LELSQKIWNGPIIKIKNMATKLCNIKPLQVNDIHNHHAMSESNSIPASGLVNPDAAADSATAQAAEAAVALKERGNEAYRSGDLSAALRLFSEAIELDGTNAVLLTNRSLCHAAMGDWTSSARDAARAVQLAPLNLKAHCRLARAQVSRFRVL
jgi:tetratricopeptide (TPR) repeat protein